jgi:hypothetical protein
MKVIKSNSISALGGINFVFCGVAFAVVIAVVAHALA